MDELVGQVAEGLQSTQPAVSPCSGPIAADGRVEPADLGCVVSPGGPFASRQLPGDELFLPSSESELLPLIVMKLEEGGPWGWPDST